LGGCIDGDLVLSEDVELRILVNSVSGHIKIAGDVTLELADLTTVGSVGRRSVFTGRQVLDRNPG
jgi:hypothetical protein